MNILLLGANGQVGRELAQVLATIGEVSAFTRQGADLEDFNSLQHLVRKLSPDIIVNAAAYTAVDKAESEPEKAYRINGEAPELLAREAKRINALLVHYSTDYVFDGQKQEPYLETDTANPLSVYGKSKLAGEEAIVKSGCNYLVFRTSWVFGVHGNNFIKTILRLARERDVINVVADQFGAPTSAELIAGVTAQAIPAFLNGTISTGIYHLTSGGSTTWYEFAQFIVRCAVEYGVTLKLAERDVQPIPAENYPTPARRPANSRLDTMLLQQTLSITLPEWQQQVRKVVSLLAQPLPGTI